MFAALVGSRWHLARITLVPATKEKHMVLSFLFNQNGERLLDGTRVGFDPAPVEPVSHKRG